MHLWRSHSRSEKVLLLLFLLTLPFVHPQVRGDGIGYYAYARSLLIDHNLQFKGDWKPPNPAPFLTTRNKAGHIVATNQYTKTGHIANFYPVGPAILWAPFLAVAHVAVLGARQLGSTVSADGFSRPYLMAMAFATALYGFLGLLLSFRLARSYFEERWALWATVAIWFGSSLPVYMYVDPAWSHAHSMFVVALFLWYWNRTRGVRTGIQWFTLGLISGLMLDVYFANAVFLAVVLPDFSSACRSAWHERKREGGSGWSVLRFHILYGAGILISLLPTVITRAIIFGNPLAMGGYANDPWRWTSPAFGRILFSSSHGLLTTTPILIPAVLGLFLLWRQVPNVGGILFAAALAFYILIAVYPWWNGVVSFGNRFFVSLTPLFILGLSAAFSGFARLWGNARAAAWRIATVSALLIVWNLGLVFQWSTGLLPSVGPVYWDEVLYNEFRVVPGEMLQALRARFALLPDIPHTKSHT